MLINPANIQAMYIGYQSAFDVGFGQADTDHELFTMTVNSSTSTEEYPFLGEDESLKEWAGERVIRGIKAHGYSIKNRKFERTVGVDRDTIEDDRYGTFSKRFERMGMSAARHPCEISYEALKNGFDTKCFDGQYFFDSDHPGADGVQSNTGGGNGSPWFLIDENAMMSPIIFQKRKDYILTRMDSETDESVFMRNLFRYGVDARVAAGYGIWQTAYGSKQPLTPAAYQTAREAMLAFKNDAGVPIGCKPTHLICAPSNEKEGLEILNAERLANGATNVYKGTAQLLATPWLS